MKAVDFVKCSDLEKRLVWNKLDAVNFVDAQNFDDGGSLALQPYEKHIDHRYKSIFQEGPSLTLLV